MPSLNSTIYENVQDTTAAVFDTFYNPQGAYPVDAATYDAAVSFFIQQSKSPVQARKLADIVFKIASNTGQPAAQILDDFMTRKNYDVDAQLNLYLNQINSRATLQGLVTGIQNNFFVARTVLD